MKEDFSQNKKAITIAGVVPFTTHDYPNHLSAVIFLQGCKWRCGYCHNPHLWPLNKKSSTSWEDTLAFLKRRKKLLDGVVFSGGEATLHSDLINIMNDVKNLGFKIGLHTSGAYPQALKSVLPLLSWVGLDIKTTFKDYDAITHAKNSAEGPYESLDVLVVSGTDFEVRTTLHPFYHNSKKIFSLAKDLQQRGVRRFVLQEFRKEGCITEPLRAESTNICDILSQPDLDKMAQMFDFFEIRYSK